MTLVRRIAMIFGDIFEEAALSGDIGPALGPGAWPGFMFKVILNFDSTIRITGKLKIFDRTLSIQGYCL